MRFQPSTLRFTLLTLNLLLLAGCREDFSSSANQCVDDFGPAFSVDKPLASFRVGDGKEFPASLRERTLMRTFFMAISPIPEDSSPQALRGRTLAKQAGIVSHPFIGFDEHFPEQFPDYTSTRNMPDLIEALIASDRIDTFNNARNAMRRCVEQDRGGSYRNNQVRLTLIPGDQGNDGVNGDNPEPEEWRLQLRYDNNRRPGGGLAPNISRFINLTDAGITYQTLYDPQRFSATGYNRPREIRTFFNRSSTGLTPEGTDDNARNAQLSFIVTRPDSQSPGQDLFLWTGRDQRHNLEGPNGENMAIGCMIFRADYVARQVEVWTQQESCGVLDDLASLEPLENFSYTMGPVNR